MALPLERVAPTEPDHGRASSLGARRDGRVSNLRIMAYLDPKMPFKKFDAERLAHFVQTELSEARHNTLSDRIVPGRS